MSKETISRERLEAPPGTIYAETILEPSHLFMLEHYFSPLAAWTKPLRSGPACATAVSQVLGSDARTCARCARCRSMSRSAQLTASDSSRSPSKCSRAKHRTARERRTATRRS